ncbi:MAG TPA: signal recognition particle-docking protein FtsY [Rhabdochlamydiaceae bacterium]|nr:signal recognition particle-docking protein FtsY [Rhabdochlamydiaceae bacterium]
MFSIFKRIKSALTKTRSFLGSKIKALFSSSIDAETLEQLENILYQADIGSQVTGEFVDDLKEFLKKKPNPTPDEILARMRSFAQDLLDTAPKIQSPNHSKAGEPLVYLIVGINGSGKTTSVAKLAHLLKKEGKKVLLAAGDTFRAGAIDQLSLWAGKIGVDIVKAQSGSDPSSVAFDALTAAKSRGMDTVIIDTAGRLQNKTDLMQELDKIRRVCNKVVPGSPHEIILVLDATIGQNAVEQAQVFHQFTPLTGILMAKLDGSAKGGVILPIYRELGIPIRWVGVGEQIDDLTPFDSNDYVLGLFE